MAEQVGFPSQRKSFKAKNKSWRKQCVDWGVNHTFSNYSPVRKSVVHKKINYDLVNGKLHMADLQLILNPDHLKAKFIPDNIQHYPIMNSKLNLLRGEESNRIFDYRAVVTNPNALSEIESRKQEALQASIMQAIEMYREDEDRFNRELEKISHHFQYEWQDEREIMCNSILQHYSKEQNFKLQFTQGFMDAAIGGEEIYQCSIQGGEPILEKINPLKIRIFRSGFSNKIEDADVIVLEDYMSPGKIIDMYYDVLSEKDIKKINEAPNGYKEYTDALDNYDETKGFIHMHMIDDAVTIGEDGMGEYWDPFNVFSDGADDTLLPYDANGNIRVVRVYWKSMRKIKKIKHYDPTTGDEMFDFFSEDYVPNTDAGEEEEVMWINQAWEGVKVGDDIYVNMRPCPVQYNSLSNPSKCHFGIIGSVYNIVDAKPFSLVDMMKQYNYLYDVVHDRLNKMMAHNWGKLVRFDFAQVPKGWDVDKWMYYARVNGLYITDSFKEGNYGQATGKLAGSLNNNTTGVIDAEFGNSIQSQINLLEFIKLEMSEITGITKQREGNVSNRETVGGIERSNLQSSHITEWLFATHDDIKKRALECFIDTAKVAMKGRKLKFNYILSDGSMKVIDIDGDMFNECDYGIVVDYSDGMQQLHQQIGQLAQAALQNQAISFSTMLKMYNTSSLVEKERLVEQSEREMLERAQQAQQQQAELEQQKIQAQAQLQEAQMQQQDIMNQRDNDTRLLVAQISANSKQQDMMSDGIAEPEEMSENERESLREKIREFDAKIDLDRKRLEFDRSKHNDDIAVKKMAIRNKPSSSK